MPEPIITTAAIVAAIAGGLTQVGGKLLEKGVINPALETATEKLSKFVKRGPQQAQGNKALLGAVETALAQIDVPTDDDRKFQAYVRNLGLSKLTAPKNHALRRQVGQAILSFSGRAADPPEDLIIALGWPRRQRAHLAAFLSTLRAELFELEEWRAPLEYANEAAKLGLLDNMLTQLARLDRVFVETAAGEALRVIVERRGLGRDEAAEIETRYRDDLVRDWRLHDFRGIVQVRQDVRLPLADIYLELGLLGLGGETERQGAREQLLTMREDERLVEEERRLENRVGDALARAQRLVILGEPGSGKTISLRFITLMLAHGYGAARLGLEAPHIPLLVRLADFARALDATPALSLDNFLMQYIQQAYTSHRQLSDFLRLALEQGSCMVLLDGLDEVGGEAGGGQPLRIRVVERVQQFAERWCAQDRANRLVVTSRIEGYWDEPLRGVEHAQLSPLRPPDDVREFLLRWYMAHEQAHDPDLSLAEAERRAEAQVTDLLPAIMAWTSVRRLATNPLLLTILALIHENVGRLPNRRITLYKICAQTLIESWRQAQTGLPSELLAELGEEMVIRVMAPLAYWLHETQPGGTAPFEAWRRRLEEILTGVGYETEAADITRRFLHHARYEAGLLAERGLGQFGFFHLTFEEYLAAREIARQRVKERRAMLKAHWEDPRWHEVILLVAGQLGIEEVRPDDVSDFIEDLLQAEPAAAGNLGRQVVLADIGPRSVGRRTGRWVLDALQETMQDLNPDTKIPYDFPLTPIRVRYDAGEVLDELGWLPPDLNAWLHCPNCADGGGDLLAMKYPLTNAQFERFILAGCYDKPAYWGGEESAGWGYRQRYEWSEPRYWAEPRFGRERRGYPVVGVSWYEAAACAAWLSEVLARAREGDPDLPPEDRALIAGLLDFKVAEIQLPTETAWEKLAGGTAADRFPWHPPGGPAGRDEAAGLARANTQEAGLRGTSPVAMYPLGAGRPFGLIDLGGNIWEWTDSWYDTGRISRVLKGGSLASDIKAARCGARGRLYPDYWNNYIGFRLVSPVVSGS